jgi:hypothetical protein
MDVTFDAKYGMEPIVGWHVLLVCQDQGSDDKLEATTDDKGRISWSSLDIQPERKLTHWRIDVFDVRKVEIASEDLIFFKSLTNAIIFTLGEHDTCSFTVEYSPMDNTKPDSESEGCIPPAVVSQLASAPRITG